MANSEPKVRVRMYRQGLGDCFLLTFLTGDRPVHMLVDCGTLGNSATGVKMLEVVEDIAQATNRHLDLLVLTHEHKDHVSGFNTGRDLFKEFKVENVWVAWTENSEDLLAKEIKKYKGDLINSLLFAIQTLSDNSCPNEAEQEVLGGIASATSQLLNFDGETPAADGKATDQLAAAGFAKSVNEAMNFGSRLAGGLPEYRQPGEVIEPKWLPDWRFYVLGPPRNVAALNLLGAHDSPELYHLSKRQASDMVAYSAFYSSEDSIAVYRATLDGDARQQFEASLPFDVYFRVEKHNDKEYERLAKAYESEKWRRIDYDWLASSEDLALQLNNATNNTSLVLAIEYIPDKRVLLFPADAQLGNWQSWEKLEFQILNPDGTSRKVTTHDLLDQTVLYKVGHHASHNATLKEKGLEAMKSKDLVALIPVDSTVAENKAWVMPAHPLYEVLLQKTRGRVLRSDMGWPTKKPGFWTDQEWKEIQAEWEQLKPSSESSLGKTSTIDIQPRYIEIFLH